MPDNRNIFSPKYHIDWSNIRVPLFLISTGNMQLKIDTLQVRFGNFRKNGQAFQRMQIQFERIFKLNSLDTCN